MAARKNWVVQASAREEFISWFVRDARRGQELSCSTRALPEQTGSQRPLPMPAFPLPPSLGQATSRTRSHPRGIPQGNPSSNHRGAHLDEGVDVPDANVAVIAAGSSVTRQAIQRAGRVLRKVRDKRAKIVRIYITASREDPDAREGGSEFENIMLGLGAVRDSHGPVTPTRSSAGSTKASLSERSFQYRRQ